MPVGQAAAKVTAWPELVRRPAALAGQGMIGAAALIREPGPFVLREGFGGARSTGCRRHGVPQLRAEQVL